MKVDCDDQLWGFQYARVCYAIIYLLYYVDVLIHKAIKTVPCYLQSVRICVTSLVTKIKKLNSFPSRDVQLFIRVQW